MDDLVNSADWIMTITVSKKDLEKLIAAYKVLRQERDEKKK